MSMLQSATQSEFGVFGRVHDDHVRESNIGAISPEHGMLMYKESPLDIDNEIAKDRDQFPLLRPAFRPRGKPGFGSGVQFSLLQLARQFMFVASADVIHPLRPPLIGHHDKRDHEAPQVDDASSVRCSSNSLPLSSALTTSDQ
jgi:hypothetical protein